MNWVHKNRKKLELKNYVLKADVGSKYWFGLSKLKINEYYSRFGSDFNIILIGSETNLVDYYSIPYVYIEDLLIDENLSKSENRTRWVGDIRTHNLHIRNARVERNILDFYGLPLSLTTGKLALPAAEVNDYAIENAKREVNIRLKQSVFRQRVMENFNYECCLTGITEGELLIASHIIPWAHQIEHRLNPGNGLCLSIFYDKLFDKGYFTLDLDWKVQISSRVSECSEFLQSLLKIIDQKSIAKPLYYPPMEEALIYHTENIFDKFEQ
ncbi:HNH endonuclease [Mucilaginibacter sp.]|uniref:HNH endonuclease n=1 Tax=Mucilaginibacter sp. TaxID=1882438 RepID=UPI00262A2D16|nr:HNH endonuclease [Mucilaginibacter sp.]MDB4925932.1 hypothetical protein [Mucilaginibacter sp.]MDF2432172.1 putative restriction endonuclease [Mucilaginibacter sp.]